MRFLYHIYAWMCGHSWTACPVCRQMFGAHEWPLGVLWDARPYGRLTCPACRVIKIGV